MAKNVNDVIQRNQNALAEIRSEMEKQLPKSMLVDINTGVSLYAYGFEDKNNPEIKEDGTEEKCFYRRYFLTDKDPSKIEDSDCFIPDALPINSSDRNGESIAYNAIYRSPEPKGDTFNFVEVKLNQTVSENNNATIIESITKGDISSVLDSVLESNGVKNLKELYPYQTDKYNEVRSKISHLENEIKRFNETEPKQYSKSYYKNAVLSELDKFAILFDQIDVDRAIFIKNEIEQISPALREQAFSDETWSKNFFKELNEKYDEVDSSAKREYVAEMLILSNELDNADTALKNDVSKTHSNAFSFRRTKSYLLDNIVLHTLNSLTLIPSVIKNRSLEPFQERMYKIHKMFPMFGNPKNIEQSRQIWNEYTKNLEMKHTAEKKIKVYEQYNAIVELKEKYNNSSPVEKLTMEKQIDKLVKEIDKYEKFESANVERLSKKGEKGRMGEANYQYVSERSYNRVKAIKFYEDVKKELKDIKDEIVGKKEKVEKTLEKEKTNVLEQENKKENVENKDKQKEKNDEKSLETKSDKVDQSVENKFKDGITEKTDKGTIEYSLKDKKEVKIYNLDYTGEKAHGYDQIVLNKKGEVEKYRINNTDNIVKNGEIVKQKYDNGHCTIETVYNKPQSNPRVEALNTYNELSTYSELKQEYKEYKTALTEVEKLSEDNPDKESQKEQLNSRFDEIKAKTESIGLTVEDLSYEKKPDVTVKITKGDKSIIAEIIDTSPVPEVKDYAVQGFKYENVDPMFRDDFFEECGIRSFMNIGDMPKELMPLENRTIPDYAKTLDSFTEKAKADLINNYENKSEVTPEKQTESIQENTLDDVVEDDDYYESTIISDGEPYPEYAEVSFITPGEVPDDPSESAQQENLSETIKTDKGTLEIVDTQDSESRTIDISYKSDKVTEGKTIQETEQIVLDNDGNLEKYKVNNTECVIKDNEIVKETTISETCKIVKEYGVPKYTDKELNTLKPEQLEKLNELRKEYKDYLDNMYKMEYDDSFKNMSGEERYMLEDTLFNEKAKLVNAVESLGLNHLSLLEPGYPDARITISKDDKVMKIELVENPYVDRLRKFEIHDIEYTNMTPEDKESFLKECGIDNFDDIVDMPKEIAPPIEGKSFPPEYTKTPEAFIENAKTNFIDKYEKAESSAENSIDKNTYEKELQTLKDKIIELESIIEGKNETIEELENRVSVLENTVENIEKVDSKPEEVPDQEILETAEAIDKHDPLSTVSVETNKVVVEENDLKSGSETKYTLGRFDRTFINTCSVEKEGNQISFTFKNKIAKDIFQSDRTEFRRNTNLNVFEASETVLDKVFDNLNTETVSSVEFNDKVIDLSIPENKTKLERFLKDFGKDNFEKMCGLLEYAISKEIVSSEDMLEASNDLETPTDDNASKDEKNTDESDSTSCENPVTDEEASEYFADTDYSDNLLENDIKLNDSFDNDSLNDLLS